MKKGINCRNCPLRKLDIFAPFSDDDVRFMETFKMGEIEIAPGKQILSEGGDAPHLYTVLSGMGIRDKVLENGSRQVVGLVFPGDFLGLQAGVMSKMGHSVEARTQMRLCVFDRANLWNFFRSHPGRAFDITWLAAMEEQFLGDSLATVGQRDALQSLAWALFKIYQRGSGLNLVKDGRMALPYTQRDIADALGLSLVHTNKTLAKLRDRQLVSWGNGTLVVHDAPALAELAMVPLEPPERRPLM